MKIRFAVICFSWFCCLMITGCLYRGDGVFKKIGNSDYKAKLSVLNVFVVADGCPTYICGAVFLEDRITPLRNAHILLIKGDQTYPVSSADTDNRGEFNMTGLYANDYYSIEIDSPDYSGKKTILVEPNKNNWHEIYATKKAK